MLHPQEYVHPDEGNSVELYAHAEVFAVPDTDEGHVCNPEVTMRLLTFTIALVEPRSPTCAVVEAVVVNVP